MFSWTTRNRLKEVTNEKPDITLEWHNPWKYYLGE
jgi:hypothetical protein